MGAGEAALRRIEELNRRANEAGAADVAEWENLRADYSWALEEVRRVMEVSASFKKRIRHFKMENWVEFSWILLLINFLPNSNLPKQNWADTIYVCRKLWRALSGR